MRSLFVLFLFLTMSSGAMAQDVNPKQLELDMLVSQMATIETAVEEKREDDVSLVKLRIDLETFSKSLIDFGVSLRPRLNEINLRLDELGVPPKDGEPAEPESISNERKTLLQEKAQYNGMLASAESLSIRANQTIDKIGELRRQLFTNTLFKRTDIEGAISSGTWGAFSTELAAAWEQVSSRLQFLISFRQTTLLLATSLSLIFGLGTYLFVRRAYRLMGMSGARDAELSYIAKLSLAFWSTLIPSLAVAASLGATYGLIIYFGIFATDTLNLAEALLVSCAAIFFIQRLAHALLAPRVPPRRLILVSDKAARWLVTLIVTLAVIHVLDYFFGRVYVTLSSPLGLTVAKSLISSVAISLILIMIALVKPFIDETTGASRAWPRWVRLPIILIALFIIGVAATGYIGLARFTASQIVVTGAILATMYIGIQSGHVLATEAVFQRSTVGKKLKSMFSLTDTAVDQLGLLLSFAVYATVIIIGLPLILLQWGFNQIDIQNWLFRIFTDIRVGTISISLLGILFGVLLFAAGYLLTGRFQHWLDGSVMARSKVDLGVRNSIRTIVGYAGIVIAAMIGLSAAGFDLSSLALVAGALSLGIGFGLQNIVSNFVSGLILLAERPFKVGDWIVAGTTAGFVRKISVRATEIETFQHQTVILPNSDLINSAVGNWTHRDHRGRVEVPVGVAYGVNPRKVHEILMDIAEKDESVLNRPEPSVIFTGFGESSLDFELRVHLAEVLDSMVVATRLRFAIVEAFEANNIPMPFPQRDVNLKVSDIEAFSEAAAVVKKPAPRPKKTR